MSAMLHSFGPQQEHPRKSTSLKLYVQFLVILNLPTNQKLNCSISIKGEKYDCVFVLRLKDTPHHNGKRKGDIAAAFN